MALQFSTTLRNDMMSTNSAITEVWNTVLGSSATMVIYTGSVPAACSTSASGTLLVTLTLNSSPFGVASAGAMILGGLTLTANAGNSGTAGYFRLLDGSAACHVQGTVGQGTGDISFDNATFVSGQAVNITGFTITAPGA